MMSLQLYLVFFFLLSKLTSEEHIDSYAEFSSLLNDTLTCEQKTSKPLTDYRSTSAATAIQNLV